MIEVYGSTETAGIGTRTGPDQAYRLLSHLERRSDRIYRDSDGVELQLQDRLAWIRSAEFHVEGRLDGVVQIAGTNVSPSAVREQIASMKGVEDADVRLDGTRLRAFVVPSDKKRDQRQLEAEIRAFIGRNLPAPARPDRFDFGPSLPRTQMGKPARWWDQDKA